MKRDNVFTAVCACALGTTLAAGSIFCLTSGFSLPIGSPTRLTLLWAGTSLLCSILFQLPRGKELYLLASAFLWGYLWRLGTPLRQSLYLLGKIGEIYDQAYHWGIPTLCETAQSLDQPLMLLGWVTASAVSFWVCQGKGLSLAIAGVLLPLAPCFVVTDTVPASFWLVLTMTGLGELILTAQVRQKSIPQANRLTAAAFLPILLLVSAVFWCVPRGEYTNHSEQLRQQLFQWAQAVPDQLSQAMTTRSTKPADNVSLDALGPQSPSSRQVLTVTTQTSGPLYLRGRHYDCYTGMAWSSDPSRSEIFTASPECHNAVTIQTEDVLAFQYLPYYPSQSIVLSDGMAPNLEKAAQYTIAAGSLTNNPPISDTPEDIYLALPENADYTAILDTILSDSGASSGAKAAAIGCFVRSQAVYDLNTGKMSPTAPDFVLWFLEDSQRGYCVHFATAAAVLLRAAGIPSRYVTGFLVQTLADRPTVVTQKEAHAWAEYYDPEAGGWLILEATPADAAIQPTTPEETTAASEATAPSQMSTLPDPTQTFSSPIPTASRTGIPAAAKVLTGMVLLLTALEGQRRLRLTLRRRRQTRGTVNGQALARWQEAAFLSRLLKQTPEEHLYALAQKAKFSPHDLNDRELDSFDFYLRFCRQQLRQKPWYLRLIHKYLYTAY